MARCTTPVKLLLGRVAGDAGALMSMNDSRYGLTAGMFSKNRCDRVSPRLPWSRLGDSGVGLTLSTLVIQTFTRPRAWHLRQP